MKNVPTNWVPPAFALTEDMYEMQKNTREGIDFSFHCKYYNTVQLSIPYIAPYQMMNASTGIFHDGTAAGYA